MVHFFPHLLFPDLWMILLCFLWTRMSCGFLSHLNAVIGAWGNMSFILLDLCSMGIFEWRMFCMLGSLLLYVIVSGTLELLFLVLYWRRDCLVRLSTFFKIHFVDLIGYPRCSRFVMIFVLLISYSAGLEHMRLARIPRPYGIAFFIVFGCSDELWTYMCWSIGLWQMVITSLLLLHLTSTFRNSISLSDSLKSALMLLSILFATLWNSMNSSSLPDHSPKISST